MCVRVCVCEKKSTLDWINRRLAIAEEKIKELEDIAINYPK